MEIRDSEKSFVITPLSPKLDKRECVRIFSNFDMEKEKKIALDLSCVKDCTIDFIETLKQYSLNRSISAFNIPSDMFVLFNIMGIDKFVTLFVTQLDFEDNARQLINRKFRIA